MRSPAIVLLALAALSSPALAHPGGHEGDAYYRPTRRPAEPTVIPETLAGVVSALRDGVTAVSTALDAGKIADLRRACVNLTDLAAAVPGKADSLSADARAKAATTATHLQQKAAELYSAAAAGDAPAGKTAIVAIAADIDVLAGLVK
jgi:hypothetical protein